MRALIEAVGVTKVYDAGGTGRRALDDVSMSVREGEFVAVMGPSGSGKSTLLNVLGGIDRSFTGSVRLGDALLESCGDDELAMLRRRKIGFVFQAFNLVPVLSAVENVALPGVIDGRRSHECTQRARELLAGLGLGGRDAQMPSELSGGEQQRVAIARALFAAPEVILADEPTGNLDSRAGADVLDLLVSANEAVAQTVVMVTHDPVAAAKAGRVVGLRDGSVVGVLDFANGEPESVRRRNVIRWLDAPAGGVSSARRARPLVAP